jgi:hypothetical protein
MQRSSYTDPSQHVEAVAVSKEGGPVKRAEEWLTSRGFEVMPLAAGLLIIGTRGQFEDVFKVDLGEVGSRRVELPVPPELQEVVSSITIPRPPTIQSSYT